MTTNYTLDLAAGLTQVLEEGTNTYLYGMGRIAQQNATGTEYFLTHALGSVRQLVDADGELLLAESYEPYGEGLSGAGSGDTSYGFTGEMTDLTGLIYLRARYYAPQSGRFLTKDVWPGEYTRPLSLNGWIYGYGNPVNQT
jgi:RHS repeat-associated protein